jgi:hypothetical protein
MIALDRLDPTLERRHCLADPKEKIICADVADVRDAAP